MFVIKASTPEAMRDQIVKWLNSQASNHRVSGRIATRKGMQKSEAAIADTYEQAAKFLEGCTVES